jgi:hypothetical protein
MADLSEVFGLDDDLPSWTEDDKDDTPAELDGLDDAGLLEEPLPPPPPGLPLPPLPPELPPLPEFPFPEGPLPTPPEPVGKLTHGRAIWVTQRPKPYTNCMFASVCVVLSFMGYDLPRDFVKQLRDASGVDPDFPTSTGDTKRALRQLIPGALIKFGGLNKTDLLNMLADGEIVARVMLSVRDLPDGHPTKKHFKPGTGGGHAVALAGAKPLGNDDFEVLWMDPMGRPVNTYAGIPVVFSEVEQALRLSPSGKVRVTFGFHDAALP